MRLIKQGNSLQTRKFSGFAGQEEMRFHMQVQMNVSRSQLE